MYGLANQQKKWFIRLGSKNIEHIPKPGKQEVAPRIHYIDTFARTFKNAVTRLARNSPQEDSTVTSSGGAATTSSHPCPEPITNLVTLRLQSQVIPLLISNCASIQWKQEVDTSQIEILLHSIMTEANKKREEELSGVLCTTRTPVSPQSKNKDTFCPTIKRY